MTATPKLPSPDEWFADAFKRYDPNHPIDCDFEAGYLAALIEAGSQLTRMDNRTLMELNDLVAMSSIDIQGTIEPKSPAKRIKKSSTGWNSLLLAIDIVPDNGPRPRRKGCTPRTGSHKVRSASGKSN